MRGIYSDAWTASLFFNVYFTIIIDAPPAIFKNPPMNIALYFNNWAIVTKKGAPIFPKLDIASDIPSPVDLI